MKRFYYLVVITFAFLIGCQNEEDINGMSTQSMVLVDASLESSSSRTILEGENNSVVWEEGDVINAYLGSVKSYQGNINEGVGETFARFSIKTNGDLDLGGGIEGDGTVFYNVAYYPYMESGITLTKDGNNYQIATAFPSVQEFRNNSFGKGVSPMIAVAEGFIFPFRNVGSIIKFRLTGEAGKKITRVTLQVEDEVNEGKYQSIAGNCIITTSLGGTPSIEFKENAESTITLDCGEGVELGSEYVTFVFAVPPMNYGAGKLVATFYDAEQGYMEWRNKEENELPRSDNARYTITYNSTASVNEAKLIQQAIKNGQASYTLMNDVTIANENDKINVPEGVEFTLDLGGKTIVGNVYNALENNGTLVLQNGKIDPVDGEEGRRCITNNNGATLTIKEVEIIQNYNGKNSAISNYGTCVIEDATITSDSYCIWNEGEMTIKGGVYNCKSNEQDGDVPAYLINNTNKGVITIEDGIFNCTHGAIATSAGAETKVNGGQFNRTTPNGIITSSHTFYIYGAESKLTVNDCKVNWTEIAGSSILYSEQTATVANINFYGGLYNSQNVNSQYVITWQESGNAEYPYQVIDGGWKQVDETNYEIYNAYGLKWFRDQVNNGNNFKNKIVTVTDDIDLKNEAWEPIGVLSTKNYFSGTFDGGNKTIKNLNVNVEDGAAGLFGAVQNCLEIKNITIVKATVKSNHYAGVIVGWLQENGSKNIPTISNCTVKQSTITVTPNNGDYGDKAGAIVGYAASETKINGCTTYDVTITGYRDLGGIVGMANSTETYGYVTISNNKLMLTTINYSAEGAYKAETPTTFGEIYGRGDANVSGNTLSKVTVNWPEEVCAFIGGKGYLSINEAVIAATDGAVVNIKEGAFELSSQIGDGKTAKTVTLKGAGMDVTNLKGAKNPYNNNNYPGNYANGLTLKFEDLTFTTVNEGYQGGFGHAASVEFTDCKIVGQFYAHSNAPHKFVGCTIDPLNGYLYTYASNCDFEGCTFTASEGKALQVYAEAAGEFTTNITNCTFTAAKQATTWDGKPVTGIDVNSANGAKMRVNIDGCTTTGFPTGLNSGSDLWNVKNTTADIIVNVDNAKVWPHYEKDANGNVVVYTGKGLKEALTQAGAAGAGNTTIKLNGNLDMAGIEWTPIMVDGYNGADIVTIEGNNAIITGLEAPLFQGGFAGGSGIVIKNLTIDQSNIISANTQGSGAFVECSDSQEKIYLENCHLKNSTVKGSRTGGLVGWTSGYSNINDGPVKSYITFKGCSVLNCTIEGTSSVGGLNGHAGASDWTYTTIENCIVTGCTLKSTDIGDWRVGVAVGTANAGEVTIKNLTESGNTITQTGKTAPVGEKRNYFGRLVPGSTGKLVIDDAQYITSNPQLAACLTADEQNISVVLVNDVDLPISSLGEQTGGSGEYKLGGASTEKINIDLNGKRLNITTTYWSAIGANNNNATITIKNGTMTSSQATGTWNSYDVTFANCNYVIEDVDFLKSIAFTNAGKKVDLTNVDINETHDYYALWISAAGQTVNIDGGKITSAGRGIKIDDEYVNDATALVNLTVKNYTFETAKKAAIMVKSPKGADITLSNVNINNVAADNVNAVWCDADAVQYTDLITVSGGTKIDEP